MLLTFIERVNVLKLGCLQRYMSRNCLASFCVLIESEDSWPLQRHQSHVQLTSLF